MWQTAVWFLAAAAWFGVGPVLVRLQVMDDHELRCYFRTPSCLGMDLRLVAGRWVDSVGQPPLEDERLFPPWDELRRRQELVWSALNFWQTRRQFFTPDSPGGRQASAVEDYLVQQNQLLGKAATASHEGYTFTSRRSALGELRKELGAQAYYAGQLPPDLPTWLFRPLP